MKTREELNALKEEVEALNKKLRELTEAELAQVTGGDVTSSNVVGYAPSDDPAINKPLECMFGASAIIK